MNEAIRQILASYEIRSLEDSLRALREVMQEIALLGLWRSKFFEKAAFCGGTATAFWKRSPASVRWRSGAITKIKLRCSSRMS